jgi:hypothetical protein
MNNWREIIRPFFLFKGEPNHGVVYVHYAAYKIFRTAQEKQPPMLPRGKYRSNTCSGRKTPQSFRQDPRL